MRQPASVLCLSSLGLGLLLGVSAVAQGPQYGAESPQATVAGMQRAAKNHDFAAALAFVAPAGRRQLAEEGVSGVLMLLKFSDPDDPMPGSKPLPKAELEKKRTNYRAAADVLRGVLQPHGLDSLIGKPPLSPETKKVLGPALDKADTVVLVSSLMAALDKVGPLLGLEKDDSKKMPFEIGLASNYQIKGDRATAKTDEETLDFVRIDGRWYLTPPAPPPGR